MEYLLNSIIDIDHDSESIDDIFKYNHEQSIGEETYKKNLFNDISQFIEDRFRSVRQDFTILGNRNSIAEFKCNLIIARFIILCLNQCLNYKSFTGHQALLKLFKDQLNKTLSSLREGIESLPIVDQEDEKNTTTIYSGVTIKEISEVIFYSIVLNKDQHFDVISIINKFYIKYITNSSNISTNNDSKQLFRLSKKIIRVFSENNYSEFFKIIKSDSTTYLESSILSLYINEMRIKAFNQIAISSSKKAPNTITMSLRKLKQTFLFNSNKECLKFLEWYGIDLSDINMFSLLNSSFDNDDDVNITLKTSNSIGEYVDLYQERNDLFIEIKRNKNRKDVCLNGIDLKCLKDALYNKAVEDSKKNKNISFTKSIENSHKKNNVYEDYSNEMNDINVRTNKRVVSKENDTMNRINRNNDVTELNKVDIGENKCSGNVNRKESGYNVFNVSKNLSLDKPQTLNKDSNNSIFNLKDNSITNTNANINNVNRDNKDKDNAKNSIFDNINNSNDLFSNKNKELNKDLAEKNDEKTQPSIFNSKKESTLDSNNNKPANNINPQFSILASSSLTNKPDFNDLKNNDKIENNNILNTFSNKEVSSSLIPNKEINNFSLPLNNNDLTIPDINKKTTLDNPDKTTESKNIGIKTNIEHKQKPSAISTYNTKVKSLVDNKYIKKSIINKLNFCYNLKVYYNGRLATFKERKSRNVKINFLFHLKSNILEKQYKKQVFELSYNSLIADNKNTNTNILKSLANNHQYLSSTEESFNNKYDISLLQKNNVIQNFQDILDKMIIDYIENVDKDNHYYILNPSELDLDKNNNSTITTSENQTSNLSFNEESPIVISLKLRIACLTYKPLLLKSQFYRTFFSQQANRDIYLIEENEYYLKVKYSNSISYKKTNPLNSAIVNLVYKFEIDYDTYFLDIIEAFGLTTEFVSAEFLSLISYNKYFLFIDFSCMTMLEQSLSFIQLLNIEKKDFILFYYNSEMIYFRHYLNNLMFISQTNSNTSLKEIVEKQLSKDSKTCNDPKSIHNWNILKLATDKLNITRFISILEVDEFLSKQNTSRLPNFNKETFNYDMRYKYYITNIAYQNNNLLQYLFNNKTFSFIKQEYFNKTSLNSIFNNLSFFFNNKQNIVDPNYNKIDDNLNNDSISMNKSNDNSNIKKNNMTLNASLSLPNFLESKSKSKNTLIKSVQQELILIKNSYWKNFFTQLRQAIVGIIFINEVLSSSMIINNEYLDFITKIGINQEEDADFYFFFKKIFKEFSIKINSIQMNSFFKKLFRMKDFSFEEFIKAPTLIEFLEMLLMRYEKEFIIVMEKYLDYFEVKYGFKDEEKSFRENNNYLLMKASKLSLIKELLMKNRKEFNSIFRKDINNMNNSDINDSDHNLPLFFKEINCISSCYSITYHLISYFSANIEIINRVLCGYSTHLSSSCYFSNSTLNTDYYNNNKSFLTPKWFNALLNKNHNEYSLANYKEALFSDEVIFTSVFHVFTDIHESDAFSKEDMISKILSNADKAFYSLGNIFICPEITLYMRMAHIRLNNLENMRNKNEYSTYSESKLDYMKFYLNNYNIDNNKDSPEIKEKEIPDITENINNSFLQRKRNRDNMLSNLALINNYNKSSNNDKEDIPNNKFASKEYKSRNTIQVISNVTSSNYSRLRNISLIKKINKREANGAFSNKSFNDVLLNQSFAMDN